MEVRIDGVVREYELRTMHANGAMVLTILAPTVAAPQAAPEDYEPMDDDMVEVRPEEADLFLSPDDEAPAPDEELTELVTEDDDPAL
jgi:hypothetical protein